LKNKKQDEKVPLRIVASMRVISESVVAALKAATEVLNDRPELVSLFEDLVKLVAREGNLDFLSQGEDNLPLRVAVLEQHVKDLQKAMEQREKSATQLQEIQTNENAVLAETFSKLWTGRRQGRRLMQEGIDLMQELFAQGMSDSKIAELSGMTQTRVECRRKEWEALRTTKAQSSVRKNHDHCQLTMTAPDSKVTDNSLKMVKERPERASWSGGKGQVPHTETNQSQRDTGNMLNSQETPSSSLCREKPKNSSQNPIAQRSERVDSREPRFGLNSLQRTEMANMLIERKFRAKQSGLTLKLIGKQFGISGDAVKKNYLPVLQKAGLLDKDRIITHEEILEVYASKNRLP
jgi:hypothetical protein